MTACSGLVKRTLTPGAQARHTDCSWVRIATECNPSATRFATGRVPSPPSVALRLRFACAPAVEPRSLHRTTQGEHDVSSTGARSGRREWMAPEALAFDDQSGAWTDPNRYDAWLQQHI